MTRARALLVLAALGWGGAAPAAHDWATPAERMRAQLSEAQIELAFDQNSARSLVEQATGVYGKELAPALAGVAPAADKAVRAHLKAARAAAKAGNEAALAAARATAWTALLRGAVQGVEGAVKRGDAQDAHDWLAVREFRPANRFTRLHADATVALEELAAAKVRPAEALTSVRADLLDGYQARLNAALGDLKDAQAKGYRTRASEQAALARGYLEILAPQYAAARGEGGLREARSELAALPASLPKVEARLQGWRAAPLSPAEQKLRAGQVTRFLGLVPLEYGRGVSAQAGQAGQAGRVVVTRDIEITEAKTFLAGASAAFADVQPLLQDQAGAGAVRAQFAALSTDLERAAAHANAPTPQALEGRVNALLGQLRGLYPAAWQGHDASGDLDVIRAQLDALLSAVAAGNYDLAETARLDAYATLESGPEARIAVFAPDLKLRLENLFWNGRSPDGLARLIRERAPLSDVQASRAQLDAALSETRQLLGTAVAPAAVATNAGVIVFREGLEAVLILAALMGSLRRENVRHLRRPMWWGAALAFVASIGTWLVLSGTLSLLARFGEKLEAVVSVVAIGVLLVIMNWFFHQVYWTDRMAAFQKHKHSLMGVPVGQQMAQWLGLAVLGFTSIYREGFETVLFLQSLVLQSGSAVVLSGTALGLLAVVGVGVLVFALQAKLPMKKLLVVTGGMICAVLFVMVGNTAHVLQLVGWLTVHPLEGVELPAWVSLWLGTYPTWEGLVLQVVAVVAVLGSYFLAEGLKDRKLRRVRPSPAPR